MWCFISNGLFIDSDIWQRQRAANCQRKFMRVVFLLKMALVVQLLTELPVLNPNKLKMLDSVH